MRQRPYIQRILYRQRRVDSARRLRHATDDVRRRCDNAACRNADKNLCLHWQKQHGERRRLRRTDRPGRRQRLHTGLLRPVSRRLGGGQEQRQHHHVQLRTVCRNGGQRAGFHCRRNGGQTTDRLRTDLRRRHRHIHAADTIPHG